MSEKPPMRAFGLRSNPFNPLPLTGSELSTLFVNRERELDILERRVSMETRGSFGIIGERGIGKTSLMRMAMNRLAERGYFVAEVDATASMTSTSIVRDVLYTLGDRIHKDRKLSKQTRVVQALRKSMAEAQIPEEQHRTTPSQTLVHDFAGLLEAINSQYERSVIVIDELNKYPKSAIRIFDFVDAVVRSTEGTLFSIVGSEELRQTFFRTDGSIGSRVQGSLSVEPFDYKTTLELIDRRLLSVGVASASRKVFSNDALDLIYQVSRGNPRQILYICGNTMMFSAARAERVMNQESVLRFLISEIGPLFRRLGRGDQTIVVTIAEIHQPVEVGDKRLADDLKRSGLRWKRDTIYRHLLTLSNKGFLRRTPATPPGKPVSFVVREDLRLALDKGLIHESA